MAAVSCSGSTSASSAEQLAYLGKERFAQGNASAAKKTFDKAVKSDASVALDIADFYHAQGCAADANDKSLVRGLHDNARHFYKKALERQMLTPSAALLTRLGEEYNEISRL